MHKLCFPGGMDSDEDAKARGEEGKFRALARHLRQNVIPSKRRDLQVRAAIFGTQLNPKELLMSGRVDKDEPITCRKMVGVRNLFSYVHLYPDDPLWGVRLCFRHGSLLRRVYLFGYLDPETFKDYVVNGYISRCLQTTLQATTDLALPVPRAQRAKKNEGGRSNKKKKKKSRERHAADAVDAAVKAAQRRMRNLLGGIRVDTLFPSYHQRVVWGGAAGCARTSARRTEETRSEMNMMIECECTHAVARHT